MPRHQRHLFDTLYHVVAIESNSLLVTADEKYWQKVKVGGHTELLRNF
ncbi:hypothetical protein [Thiothrix sp.]|nr:hypothetical protein [Thiothrix sp.]